MVFVTGKIILMKMKNFQMEVAIVMEMFLMNVQYVEVVIIGLVQKIGGVMNTANLEKIVL